MSDRLPTLDYHLSFADGPEAEWDVIALELDEGLGRCYHASVEIATETLDVDLGALLGATCELSMQRGEHGPSQIYGVVSRVDYHGYLDHRLHARATVVPALALAAQRRASRIWQGRSVRDIVAEVAAETLSEYERTFELGGLQRGAEAREYCVQYRETDLEFIARLLAEDGITWLFVHDGERGHEVLTLIDQNQGYATLENLDGSAILPLIEANPDEAEVESLAGFSWSQRLTSTTAARSDFDPAHPGGVLDAEHGEADARGRVRTVYTHGRRRLGGDDLGQRARDLAEALALDGSLASCESNASVARPGLRFTLDGLDHDAPREWLIVSVRHRAGELDSRDGGVRAYRNLIECVPAEVPIRPLAPEDRPRVLGPQTATVVGGGEIDTDAQGRIQVQFHWERSPGFGAGASCRVRCAQSWAGPGWGAQFIPRVGMEVVVEFLEGNPDRPLVTGCVYNGGAEPPFSLPGNSTQSGWRTNSSPGGGGSNELRFEDQAGAEEIYIHGQKDWTVEINNDTRTTIGHDHVVAVGHDRETSIQNDQRELVGQDQTIAVGRNHAETIGANMNLGVGASQTMSVGGDRSLSVGQNHAETIGASASETVAMAKSVTVGAALATIVGGAMNTSVGALSSEEVGGLKSVSVGASSSESVVGGKTVDAATISHAARKDLSLTAGANVGVSASKDLQIDAGGQLAIQGKAKGTLVLDESLTIKVGKASITLDKNGEIVIDGAKVTVKGKKSITLKSKKVNQN